MNLLSQLGTQSYPFLWYLRSNHLFLLPSIHLILDLLSAIFIGIKSAMKKEKCCQVSLAVDAFTGYIDLVRHWILMELDGLLGLEDSGEHLVGLYILV